MFCKELSSCVSFPSSAKPIFRLGNKAVQNGHDENRDDGQEHAAECGDGHRDHDVRAAAPGRQYGYELGGIE